jgi:type I restriction-modification system DNA methylase subunit
MQPESFFIQSNFLSEEILAQIYNGQIEGQKPADFGFASAAALQTQIETAWANLLKEWEIFDQALAQNSPQLPQAALRFCQQLFLNLGYPPLEPQQKPLLGPNNQPYPISHLCFARYPLPIYILPPDPHKNTLDARLPGFALSPHNLLQEYLNVSESLFGLITNGFTLRLLRSAVKMTFPPYLAFDLQLLFAQQKYNEFILLYRLLHASRFQNAKQNAPADSWLEKYFHQNQEVGNRIREKLSFAVQNALLALAQGFLKNPHNIALRQKIQNQTLTPKAFFAQLRRLIYRLLFLRVLEERNLIYPPSPEPQEKTTDFPAIYYQYYSVSALCHLAQLQWNVKTGSHYERWPMLLQTFALFIPHNSQNINGKALGLQPLNGELFSPDAIPDLEKAHIYNYDLFRALRHIYAFIDEKQNLVKINYRALDVEELGSVYENLLELQPQILEDPQNPALLTFSFWQGTERKTTGSYYTPRELVNELLQSALIPVIEAKTQNLSSPKEKAQALLQMKVCDPACGSGHILLAAARALALYHAQYQYQTENPEPAQYRDSLRKIVQNCIYGVDYNPDAVELCKLALWLESHNPNKPLSFLDPKIKNGNSLAGVFSFQDLEKPLPSEAYEPKARDDKKICQSLKKDNANFVKKRQASFDFEALAVDSLEHYAAAYQKLNALAQDSLENVKEAEKIYAQYREDKQWYKTWTACNLWVSAFFAPYQEETRPKAVTEEKLRNFWANPGAAYGPMVGQANALSQGLRFFHWFLEFPDVFAQGGFDVVLGNPPWEVLELDEKEFFKSKAPEIAKEQNSSKRKKLIEKLKDANQELYSQYIEASSFYDGVRQFLRESQRFELTARGRPNMYSLFAELFSVLIAPQGRAGIIVPTGIATDDNNKYFFSSLLQSNRLVALFDFENREGIFKDVDSRYKFSLLTVSGGSLGAGFEAKFGFFLTRAAQLQDPRRVFALKPEVILSVNPNTQTCPTFRTRQDAELTQSVYKRVGVLINEKTGENPWGISFKQGLFNMSSDSGLFRTGAELLAEGFALQGNCWVKGNKVYLPLYEAKMIWHYDHRFGSYQGIKSRSSTQLYHPTLAQYQDPCYQILPWYWVEKEEVEKITKEKWFIGFRNISNTTNERTVILGVFPYSAVGHSMPLIFSSLDYINKSLLFPIFCSLVLDYFTRQKIGGINITFGYIQQFPILSPSAITPYKALILPLIFELTYTSWDMRAFAECIWQEADKALRERLKEQWEENREQTGQAHSFTPPAWADAKEEACPLPPFFWEPERRARLKAELDAIYALLYGLNCKQLRYILDPADLTVKELEDILSDFEETEDSLDEGGYEKRRKQSDFPGQTFRVLRDKEIREYGFYRTRRYVLEAWARITRN